MVLGSGDFMYGLEAADEPMLVPIPARRIKLDRSA